MFQYFRLNLLQTCKTMNSILKQFFVVNRVLDDSEGDLSAGSLRTLTSHSRNLRTLCLSSCGSWLSDDLLRPVLKQNTKLEIVDLSFSNRCSSGLLQVNTSLHQLIIWSIIWLIEIVLCQRRLSTCFLKVLFLNM